MDVKKIKEFISRYDVLFVEDNKQTQEQITIMFKQLFRSVDSAYNGKEGLEKYINFKKNNNKYYDVVITDIRMPEMDGVELSKRIKEINSAQHILVISAHNESNFLEALINIGVNTFVHKPIDFNKLMEAICRISDLKKEETKTTKELDEAIRMNNELNALMNGYDSLVIASRTDKKGIITYVSDAFAKISGYERNELIGKDYSTLRHPDMKDSFFKGMWETIEKGKVWTGKIKNIKKDGSYYWIKTTIGPYRNKYGDIVGYNSIKQDITAQIEAEDLHRQVNLLLDNSNEGYLLIDKEGKVNSGYSKKCLSIFDKPAIKGEDINTLLFFNTTVKSELINKKRSELFNKGLNFIFNSEDSDKIENFLSLLPNLTIIGEKHISISYKYIDSNSIMLILRDITENIELKSELEKQQVEQKMIVSIIANINDFLDIDDSYQKLIQTLYHNTENTIHLPDNIGDILRELHTFKGLFYQMNMIFSPHAIHELETKIANMTEGSKHISSLNKDNDIKFLYYKDLEVIDRFLGREYLKEQRKTITKSKSLVNLKYKIKNLIKQPENMNFKLQSIISQIDQMSYDSLQEIFEKHIPLVVNLGEDLDKPMKPLKITGESDIKVPTNLKTFFRNMVHIYKNCIDHGIEDSDLRLLRGKDIKGEISCNFKHEQGFLFVTISDDGNGIDIESLKEKLLSHNLISKEELEESSETKILNYIFSEQFTTREEISDISGRGIGMSSIKKALENIKGSIKVDNKYKKGLTFFIKIPMKKVLDVYESGFYYNETINIMDMVINQIKKLITNDAKIDVINAKYVNNTDYENKIHILIDINSGVKLTFALSFNKKLLKKFAAIFYIDISDNEDDLDKMLTEVAKEIVNTIIGLSIQDFPNMYKEGILSIPYILNENEMYEKLHDDENRIITNVITTGSGNLISNLILRG